MREGKKKRKKKLMKEGRKMEKEEGQGAQGVQKGFFSGGAVGRVL